MVIPADYAANEYSFNLGEGNPLVFTGLGSVSKNVIAETGKMKIASIDKTGFQAYSPMRRQQKAMGLCLKSTAKSTFWIAVRLQTSVSGMNLNVGLILSSLMEILFLRDQQSLNLIRKLFTIDKLKDMFVL